MDEDWLGDELAKIHTNKIGKGKLSLDDVLDIIEGIATKRGFDSKRDAAIFLNVGTPSDKSEHFYLILAIIDFIYFQLRNSLGKNQMSVQTFKKTTEALRAAGFIRPNVCTVGKMDADLNERLIGENDARKNAANGISSIAAKLGNEERVDLQDMGRRLDEIMRSLSLEEEENIEDETDLSAGTEGMKMLETQKLIDQFQRFTSLCERGEPLMDQYQEMASKWFGVTSGFEQGYSILASMKANVGETDDDFHARVQKECLAITKEIQDKLIEFEGIARLSLSPTSFGMIKPVGYTPDEEDVVTIDARGAARNIFMVKDMGEELSDQMKEALKKNRPTGH